MTGRPSPHLSEQLPQPGDVGTQEAPRALDAPAFDRHHPPDLVDVHVLAAVFGVGVSQIYKRIKRGEFDKFAVHPQPIGPKRWSGVLLARYLNGEPLYAPTFGAKRPRSA